ALGGHRELLAVGRPAERAPERRNRFEVRVALPANHAPQLLPVERGHHVDIGVLLAIGDVRHAIAEWRDRRGGVQVALVAAVAGTRRACGRGGTSRHWAPCRATRTPPSPPRTTEAARRSLAAR